MWVSNNRVFKIGQQRGFRQNTASVLIVERYKSLTNQINIYTIEGMIWCVYLNNDIGVLIRTSITVQNNNLMHKTRKPKTSAGVNIYIRGKQPLTSSINMRKSFWLWHISLVTPLPGGKVERRMRHDAICGSNAINSGGRSFFCCCNESESEFDNMTKTRSVCYVPHLATRLPQVWNGAAFSSRPKIQSKMFLWVIIMWHIDPERVGGHTPRKTITIIYFLSKIQKGSEIYPHLPSGVKYDEFWDTIHNKKTKKMKKISFLVL